MPMTYTDCQRLFRELCHTTPFATQLARLVKAAKSCVFFPGFPLSYINYVFIENDEDVSAWLLSKPVLAYPLDLLVYCHRRYTADRVPTQAL